MVEEEEVNVVVEFPRAVDWLLLAKEKGMDLDEFRCNESISLMRETINNVIPTLMIACISKVHDLDPDVEKMYLAVVYDKGKGKIRVPDLAEL